MFPATPQLSSKQTRTKYHESLSVLSQAVRSRPQAESHRMMCRRRPQGSIMQRSAVKACPNSLQIRGVGRTYPRLPQSARRTK